jgi:hypothetical protein
MARDKNLIFTFSLENFDGQHETEQEFVFFEQGPANIFVQRIGEVVV